VASFPKFGSVSLEKLANSLLDPEKIFKANKSALILAGIDEAKASEFITFRTTINLTRLEKTIAVENIQLVTKNQVEYPSLLKNISQPPFLLFYQGTPCWQEVCLAVVGARIYSHYGQLTVERLIGETAQAGAVIVSGLAYGIDTLAHQTTLQNKGKTIAVLGCGINQATIYPSVNRHLAKSIVEHGGMVISEFPPFTAPLRHHFPLRNRIISGLSIATIIIEASRKSGSLITANLALEQGREVLAVPGSIFTDQSSGTNMLIKQGATPVTSSEDILAALDLSPMNQYSDSHIALTMPEDLSTEEQTILTILSQEPLHIDLISTQVSLSIGQVGSTLTLLEIKNLARNIGGMQYIKL
jgi:DNA processing protein